MRLSKHFDEEFKSWVNFQNLIIFYVLPEAINIYKNLPYFQYSLNVITILNKAIQYIWILNHNGSPISTIFNMSLGLKDLHLSIFYYFRFIQICVGYLTSIRSIDCQSNEIVAGKILFSISIGAHVFFIVMLPAWSFNWMHSDEQHIILYLYVYILYVEYCKSLNFEWT